MADVKIPGLEGQRPMANAYGNVSQHTVSMDVAAAVAQNDVLQLMRLPKGAKLIDAIVVSGAAGASVTLALGLGDVQGGATTKVDADALITATSIAAAAMLRRNNAAVKGDALKLDDDYYLEATLAGANPGAFNLEVTVIYEFLGTP